MKSITKLSLLVLTAAAFASFPAHGQTNAPPSTTNTAPAPRRPRPPGFNGKIASIDATAMTLTVTNRTGEFKVKVTSTTRISKDRQPAVFADAKEGLNVAGAGKKLDDGSWEATTLRITTMSPRPPAAPPAPAPAPPSSEQK